MEVPSAVDEIRKGKRFAFGANWSRFLSLVDEQRIAETEASLCDMLGTARLDGLRFLDVGSGSGLFSLAARRMGAGVTSFDFDGESVACARELKRRYFPSDVNWTIEQGSVLDGDFIAQLGTFDVVYSWGVLHHTGAMWVALERAISCVAPTRGRLAIAVYNDQGWKSRVWWLIKLAYNRMPTVVRPLYIAVITGMTHSATIIKYALKLRPMIAVREILSQARGRGMNARCDRVDYIGGFPFEFSTALNLVEYLEARGFVMDRVNPTTTLGCNEITATRL